MPLFVKKVLGNVLISPWVSISLLFRICLLTLRLIYCLTFGEIIAEAKLIGKPDAFNFSIEDRQNEATHVLPTSIFVVD